jgi:hypothetical protein
MCDCQAQTQQQQQRTHRTCYKNSLQLKTRPVDEPQALTSPCPLQALTHTTEPCPNKRGMLSAGKSANSGQQGTEWGQHMQHSKHIRTAAAEPQNRAQLAQLKQTTVTQLQPVPTAPSSRSAVCSLLCTLPHAAAAAALRHTHTHTHTHTDMHFCAVAKKQRTANAVDSTTGAKPPTPQAAAQLAADRLQRYQVGSRDSHQTEPQAWPMDQQSGP